MRCSPYEVSKMKIIAELHAHSGDYCWHAKDNIDIQVQRAKEMGLKYYASTNHAPILDYGTPTVFYTDNLNRKYDGIKFLAGMEADLRDLHGGLDVAQADLLRLDFVLTSMHNCCIRPDYPDYTHALIKVVENPAIDCLGHIARDPDYTYDLDAVLKAVKANGKLVEFNNASIEYDDSGERCGHVMDRCAELGIECIVTSDAHSAEQVGNYKMALEMLKEKNFPEELIVNADEQKLEAFLARRREEKDKAYAELFRA